MASQEPAKVDRVTFIYERGPLYRTVFAEGAFGGPSPGGLIEMNFYTVHRPLPDKAVHEVDVEAGVVGSEIRDERIVRAGIVREVEVAVLLTPATAKSVHKWLGERIAEIEKAQRQGEKS